MRKEMIGMKKFINAPEDVERQVVDGYVKAYPGKIAKAADDIVVRAHAKRGKVALVSGGGMGHEPAHLGFVGTGMLDAAVGGAVFTSPAVDRVDEGVCKVAAGNTGVLLVIENYTGDVVNFKMAEQNAREDGIDVDHVIADDDVAVKDLLYTVGRRGVAGTVLVHKCAGAMAETGAPLAEVKRVAQKVIDNVRTMGVAIEPCTVPAAGKPVLRSRMTRWRWVWASTASRACAARRWSRSTPWSTRCSTRSSPIWTMPAATWPCWSTTQARRRPTSSPSSTTACTMCSPSAASMCGARSWARI